MLWKGRCCGLSSQFHLLASDRDSGMLLKSLTDFLPPSFEQPSEQGYSDSQRSPDSDATGLESKSILSASCFFWDSLSPSNIESDPTPMVGLKPVSQHLLQPSPARLSILPVTEQFEGISSIQMGWLLRLHPNPTEINGSISIDVSGFWIRP